MDNSQGLSHINPLNVTEILAHFDTHGIFLTIDLNTPNQLLKIEKNPYSNKDFTVPYILPLQFEFFQGSILKRLRENKTAEYFGWVVGQYGEVYQHQYGLQNAIFIERNSNGTFDVYRCRFNKNNRADNIKTFGTQVNSFHEARDLAANFLEWFYSKSKYGSRPY